MNIPIPVLSAPQPRPFWFRVGIIEFASNASLWISRDSTCWLHLSLVDPWDGLFVPCFEVCLCNGRISVNGLILGRSFSSCLCAHARY